MSISRRNFIGACAGACILNGVQVTLGNRAHAGTGSKKHYLIYVFLNGGMDGLNYLAPASGIARANYDAARPGLGVPLKEVNSMNNQIILTLDNVSSREDANDTRNPNKGEWGLNPAASAFKGFWDNRFGPNIAFIHATGPKVANSTRSHFESKELIQRGTTKDFSNLGSGWITRHLDRVDNINSAKLPLISIGGNPDSTIAFRKRVAVSKNFGDFSFYHSNKVGATSKFGQGIESFLKEVYQFDGKLDVGINTLLDVMDDVSGITETPLNKAIYPKKLDNAVPDIAHDFHKIADLIRADKGLGVEAITVNSNDWDTHRAQGPGGYKEGSYNQNLEMLADSIKGFHEDLFNSDSNLNEGDVDYTIVFQTEFGRRLRENGSGGSDHGTAFPMTVIGTKVNTGLYGLSSTLNSDSLFGGVDVPINTDYRTVLYEVLGKGFGQTKSNLAEIFPNFDAPEDSEILGFIKGNIEDGQPGDGGSSCDKRELFSDSFE